MESHRRYRMVSSARGMEVSSFKRTFLPLEKVTILVYMLVAFSLMNLGSLLMIFFLRFVVYCRDRRVRKASSILSMREGVVMTSKGVEYVPSGRRRFLQEGEWLWLLTMVLTADLMSLSKGHMVMYCSRPRLTVRMAHSA